MIRGLRTSLVVLVLCVATFGGCFAIGRAERPRSATGNGLSSSQPTASVGASIPLSLTDAPPIDMRDITLINRSTTRRGARAARTSPFAQAAGSTTSGTLSASTGTQVASAPEVAGPVSSGKDLGTTTHTPDAGNAPVRHAPAKKTESHASHSFDSSD